MIPDTSAMRREKGDRCLDKGKKKMRTICICKGELVENNLCFHWAKVVSEYLDLAGKWELALGEKEF